MWQGQNSILLQGGISLDADQNQDQILMYASHSLDLLIEKQNKLVNVDLPEKVQVEIVLRLTEYSYMKDYQLLNTLSVEIQVVDDRGSALQDTSILRNQRTYYVLSCRSTDSIH